jgi:hypothetical protein
MEIILPAEARAASYQIFKISDLSWVKVFTSTNSGAVSTQYSRLSGIHYIVTQY